MALPVIAASLIGGLISVTGTIVGRVLVALGVGVVTYTGVQVGIDSLLSNLDSAISGVPADILGLLGFMRVGEAMNITEIRKPGAYFRNWNFYRRTPNSDI